MLIDELFDVGLGNSDLANRVADLIQNSSGRIRKTVLLKLYNEAKNSLNWSTTLPTKIHVPQTDITKYEISAKKLRWMQEKYEKLRKDMEDELRVESWPKVKSIMAFKYFPTVIMKHRNILYLWKGNTLNWVAIVRNKFCLNASRYCLEMLKETQKVATISLQTEPSQQRRRRIKKTDSNAVMSENSTVPMPVSQPELGCCIELQREFNSAETIAAAHIFKPKLERPSSLHQAIAKPSAAISYVAGGSENSPHVPFKLVKLNNNNPARLSCTPVSVEQPTQTKSFDGVLRQKLRRAKSSLNEFWQRIKTSKFGHVKGCSNRLF